MSKDILPSYIIENLCREVAAVMEKAQTDAVKWNRDVSMNLAHEILWRKLKEYFGEK